MSIRPLLAILCLLHGGTAAVSTSDVLLFLRLSLHLVRVGLLLPALPEAYAMFKNAQEIVVVVHHNCLF